jgi:hypothetical protein
MSDVVVLMQKVRDLEERLALAEARVRALETPRMTSVVITADAFADVSPAKQKAAAEQIVARALAPKDPT